jgi:Carboxypeptidase regulatory-like domain
MSFPAFREGIMRAVALVLALMTTVACADDRGGLPSSPTPQPDPQPPPQTWTLSGTISETAPTASTRIANATVTIVSGPDDGRSVRSDANGAFQVAGLKPAQFTVRTQSPNYVDGSHFVTLDRDQTIAIGLDPVFQIVTTTKEDSISGGDACPGYWDYWSSPQTGAGRANAAAACQVDYLFDVHHDGTLTAEVAWTDPRSHLFTELYRTHDGQPSNSLIDPRGDGYDVHGHQQYIVRVRSVSTGGGPPPAGTTTFRLTVTRPN